MFLQSAIRTVTEPTLTPTQPGPSIKSFAYHLTTLKNFKNWLASGNWHLATGNWQATTDGERNCLIYILSSHYGARNKMEQRLREGRRRIGMQWADHVRGAFQFTQSLSARRRGATRLTIANNQWEMRVHFRTFCINWKRVVPAQRNQTKRIHSLAFTQLGSVQSNGF